MTDGPDPALDDRLRFYLEHHDLIETWHRLRRETTRFCADTLELIVPGLSDVADQRGLEVHASRTGKWRILSIAEPGAPMAADGTRLAAVTISWADEVIPNEAASAPWVGVRVAIGDPLGPAVRERVGDLVRPERNRRGAQGHRRWPIWERVVAGAGWWDDPKPYLNELVDEVVVLVDQFSAPIVDAVKGVRSLEQPK